MNEGSVETLLRSAVTAHKAGRLNDARGLYRSVLAKQPKNVAALHLLGVLTGQSGAPAEAVELIRRALAVKPDAPEIHADLGEMLRRAGDVEGAVASFEKAIALNGRNPATHFNLGLARMMQRRHREAMVSFKSVTTLNPGAADAWHGLGLAAAELELHGEAIAAFERVLAMDPKRPDSMCALANLLDEIGQTDRAMSLFRSALTINKDFVPALRGLALTERDTERAIEFIHRAIALAPGDGDLLLALGHILRRVGRFSESFDAYKSALAFPSSRASACYGLAHAKKFSAGEADLVSLMRATADETAGHPRACSTVLFALGKVHDDLGRYEEAMAHYDRANALWLESRPEHRRAIALTEMRRSHTTFTDRLIAHFGPEEIARLRQWSSPSRKPVLIVGMPRSGTTLVEQILASHSGVAAGGELRFWTDFLARNRGLHVGAEEAAKAATGYAAVLDGVSAHAKRVTDKMPHNFLALGLVHALFPEARIIHCRRDAIDTCLSIYFTDFAARHEYAYDRDAIIDFYRDYQRLMNHWSGLLSSQAILDVDYEVLIREPERVIREIVSFCSLEWESACLAPHLTERPVATASAWQARQPIYSTSTQRWRRYEPWLGPFSALGSHP
jgi:tetratricopeptide (TPR) repeat protein